MVSRHFSISAASIESGGSSSQQAEKFADKAERAIQGASLASKRLNLSEVPFTGREGEIGALNEAFASLQNIDVGADADTVNSVKNRPRVFAVSGPAGTGKSSLVEQLRPRVLSEGGFFVSGKFGQQGGGEAYTGLATAMQELVQQIVARDLDMGIRRRVRESIDPEGASVLIEVFPALSDILPDHDTTHDKGGSHWAQKAKQRRFIFRQFISAVVSPKEYKDEDVESDCHEETEDFNSAEDPLPFILVLDDIQWIDKPSLDLVSSLVCDQDLSSFLLITTSRPLEATIANAFIEETARWKAQSVNVELFRLDNLDVSNVNSIVASVLDSDSHDLSMPLAEIVHQKTRGNPFFAIEFLKALVDQGLLSYNYGEMQWTWDVKKVQCLVITDSAGDLLTEKLKRLPSDRQLILFITACLGLTFDELLIDTVIEGVKEEEAFQELHYYGSTRQALNEFVDMGFIFRGGGSYFFAHDLIKQAAHDLVMTERRSLLRLRIGQCILKRISGEERDGSSSLLTIGAELCNSSLSLLREDERIELAKYNLLAGRKSIRESAFALALHCMETGLSCLEERTILPEDSSHGLRLKLLAGAAEASYCQGNFEAMDTYADSLLCKECPDDLKVHMLFYKIKSAFAQHSNENAIAMGRDAVEFLGMARFPKNPSKLRVVKELIKTKMALRKHTKETLEALPILVDEKRLAAMKIIDVLKSSSYTANPNFFLLSNLKLVRWSIKYGISIYSPTGFAIYGFILNSAYGDVKASTMFGEVSLVLCERLDDKETTAMCSSLVFAYIHHWSNDMRSCFQPIQYSQKLSMECGDMESALFSLWYMDLVTWCTSRTSLQALGRDLQKHAELCLECRHFSGWEALISLAKSLRGLCNEDDAHFVWVDSACFDENLASIDPEQRRDPNVEVFYNVIKLQAHYLLQEPDKALEMATCTGEVGTKRCQGQMYVTRAHFYRALTFLEVAGRERYMKRNLRKANRSLTLLKKWANLGSPSCHHMVYLVEAEVAKATRQPEKANEMYSNAIKTAALSGCIQDAGTCHECAAAFHAVNNDYIKSAYHVDQAVRCFQEWGADAKVRMLRNKYTEVFADNGESGTSSNARWKL